MPPLEMVKTPPCRSSMVILPSRGLLARSRRCPFRSRRSTSCRHRGGPGRRGPSRCRRRRRCRSSGFVDDVVAVDPAVDRGDVLERLRRTALTKNDMKPSFTPCSFLKLVLVRLAQLHDGGHVHFVEGGQHGGGVLGLLEPPRDGLAQARHLHALLALGGRARRMRRGGGAVSAPALIWLATASSAASTSPLVTRPSLPVAGDLGGVDAGLGDDAIDRRPVGLRSRRRRRGGFGRLGALQGRAWRRLRARARASAAGAAAAPRRRPRSSRSPRRAATVPPSATAIAVIARRPAGAGTSTVTLSVSSSASDLVHRDGVADLLEPFGDGRLGDAFAHIGDGDVGHADSSDRQRVTTRRSSSRKALSSAWCVLERPVAGEAAAARPT